MTSAIALLPSPDARRDACHPPFYCLERAGEPRGGETRQKNVKEERDFRAAAPVSGVSGGCI
jgi:hypothetical protein